MSLFLNYDSAVVNTMAKAASLPFTVHGSTDHGFTHGFWRQHRPWAPTWSPASADARELSMVSLVAVQTTEVNMALCHCTGQGTHQSPQQQHGPRTSIWPRVAVQAIHNNIVLSSHSSTALRCQLGFRLQYEPQTPVRSSVQHWAWASTQIPAAAG